MAQASNTYDRYDLATKGETTKEDLLEIAYRISPTEVPFTTMAGRGTSDNTLAEWFLDSLADPDTGNAKIDGDEFTNDAAEGEKRVGNYHQISTKVLETTRRADRVRSALKQKPSGRQMAKKMKELKRDVEAIALGLGGHQAAVAGSNSVAPLTASVGSWLTTNVDRGVGGASGTLSGTDYGTPNAAPTDGTLRALSEATLLSVIGAAWDEGASPSIIMVSGTVKQNFSDFIYSGTSRSATQNQDQGADRKAGATVLGAVDVYVSNFGVFDIVPNRFQRGRDVFIFDPEYWKLSYLAAYEVGTLAKTHDSKRQFVITDWTVKCLNEASSGIVADVDESLAMVA